jgi:peptidoglycan/LPS O-acetylase OafA/YrhL
MQRNLTLDGWRGIAILLVLLEHVDLPSLRNQVWANQGSLGVDIFFVVSGYIITARLMEEREKTQTINLAAFYVRRAFRILPLVLCYLCVLGVLTQLLPMDTRAGEMAGALFFFRNYQYAAHPRGIYTAHFWSLSIEEHFYLFWPVLLLRGGNKRAVWIAAAGAWICAIWRIYDYSYPNGAVGRLLPGVTPGLRGLRTDMRLDGLLLGSTLALLLARPAVRAFILKNFPKETPLFCGALLFVNEVRVYGYVTLTNYVLIAMMLASSLVVKEGLAYRWLNLKPLVAIGTVSYSLYVWQQIFLLHPQETFPLWKFSVFPYNLLCACVVATCSYYFLERPLVGVGKRLTLRQAPTPALAAGGTRGEG